MPKSKTGGLEADQLIMDDEPTKLQKNRQETYHVQWDSYKNTMYVAIKVIRKLQRKDAPTKYYHKNMITVGGIDLTKPDAIQNQKAKEAIQKWDKIDKAVREKLKNVPRGVKIEI